MKERRRRSAAARLIASAFALAVAAVGCSLLVSGEVPEFQCLPDTASACPSGMVCVSSRCVMGGEAGGDMEGGDEDAPFEDVIDSGKDADAGPQELGSKCRLDAECKSRLCGSSTILTSAITQSTGPICTTPCCNSGECATGFVCFNGGTGGGYCVPAAQAQRTPPASGGKTGGATCNLSTECRSGLCEKPDGGTSRCLDTCCSDTQCTGPSICRIRSISAPGPLHDVFVCGTPEVGATKTSGTTCGANAECLNDNCIGIPRRCKPACASTASCLTIPMFDGGHCLYGSSSTDNFKFCELTTNPADLPAGAACVDNLDCQSDYCDGELKKCANVCGRDSDCASNESCRPSAANTPYLRCERKP